MASWIICCFFLCLYSQLSLTENENNAFYRLLKLGDGSFRVLRTDTSSQGFRHPSLYNEEAKAFYSRRINETGWSFLELHTNSSKTNEAQVYAAGYLEGSITHDLIYMHWYNTLGDFCKGDGRANLCQKLTIFIDDNQKWIEAKVAHLGDTDAYWHQVKLFYIQVQGLWEGYKAANKEEGQRLKFQDILWLNLQGDFEDLTEVLNAQQKNFYDGEDEEYIHPLARGLGHCSALIKVLPDCTELFVAQETWSSYQSMLRFQKKYVIPLSTTEGAQSRVAGVAMTLSSYPGVITSGDDFYLLSSGLATLETTIGNGNASLWKYVQPEGQVLESVRSMVANRLATDGRSWTKIFSRFNSGTYNNQWMIVDYNKFTAHPVTKPNDLPDEIIWVLEQIPNNIHAADVTDVLRQQWYWASYNVAYFPDIYNISGNWASVSKFGDWFTYDKNPRALIFKRDQGKVLDMESMLALMRYNDYKRDPLSRCDCNPPYSAENAIAARCDLNPANGIYPFPALGHRQHGATDAKITSRVLFDKGLAFLGVSGPTYNETRGIPPFAWSSSDFESSTPHLGHPDKWVFEPVTYQWS